MKRIRRFLAVALAVLTILTGLFSAAATEAAAETENGKIVMAFLQDKVLYTYSSLTTDWLTPPATLLMGGEQKELEKASEIATVAESKMPISYLLLIDEAISQSTYKMTVEQFAGALSQPVGTQARLYLATLNNGFHWTEFGGSKFTTTPEAFEKQVKELKIDLNCQDTDLTQGIIDAAREYGIQERRPGEVLNLVVVTDCGDKYKLAQEDVKNALKNTPPMLVHFVGLTTNASGVASAKKTEMDGIAAETGGLCNAVQIEKENQTASKERIEANAATIRTYVSGLYCVTYSYETENPGNQRFDLSLRFYQTGQAGEKPSEQVCTKEGVVTLDTNGKLLSPDMTGSQNPDDGTEHPAGTDNLADSEGTDGKKSYTLLWVIGGVLVLLGLCAFLLVRRRGMAAPQRRPTADGASILLTVEAIQGNRSLMRREMHLQQELLIGRDKACDICLESPDVSLRHARVFLLDGVLYLEDLGSANGTALSGMRIFAPNRLRSGEEITLGSVILVLKF